MAIDANLMDRLIAVIGDQWARRCVMPTLCTRETGQTFLSPAGKGDTVTMTDIEPMVAQDVTPGNFPVGYQEIIPNSRPLKLEHWKEINLKLTLLESGNAVDGTIEAAVERAVNGLCEEIDRTFFLEMAKYAYQTVGTAGTAPFASDLSALKTVATRFAVNSVPNDENRFVVLDPFGYNNVTSVAAFQDASKAGGLHTLSSGSLDQALGFQWYQSNNIPTQTTNSGTVAVDLAGTAGQTTLVTDNGAGAISNFKVGDTFTIAGNSQEYSVVAVSNGSTEQTLTIFPKLAANVADGDSITRKAAHVLNYAFHRSAVQFASRPHQQMLSMGRNSGNVRTFIEERTGIPLTIQYQEGHAQESWSLMCLYGIGITPLKEGGLHRILG
jgi:hypothetical protein